MILFFFSSQSFISVCHSHLCPLPTMSIETVTNSTSSTMPIVSCSDEDEASLVSSSHVLLDTFDFDVNLRSIVDLVDKYSGSCGSKFSSSTTTLIPSSNKHCNDVSLFMLGDHSEKGHFLPSSSIIRNEVLEAYNITSSTLDDDCNNEHEVQMKNKQEEKCIAFRCVYCKHIAPTKRAAMAEIFPKVKSHFSHIFSRDDVFVWHILVQPLNTT